MAKVFTCGLMDASMMASGKKTSSTDKVASNGATGGNTAAATLMINEKATVSFAGRTGESMPVAGIWENSTEKPQQRTPPARSAEANGRWVNVQGLGFS